MTRESGSLIICAALAALTACDTAGPATPTAPTPVAPGGVPPTANITVESVAPSPGATLILDEDCVVYAFASPCTYAFRMVLSIVSPRDVADGRLHLSFSTPTPGCDAVGRVESFAAIAGVPISITVPRLSFYVGEGAYEPPAVPPVCALPTTTTGSVRATLYEGSAIPPLMGRTFNDYTYRLVRP